MNVHSLWPGREKTRVEVIAAGRVVGGLLALKDVSAAQESYQGARPGVSFGGFAALGIGDGLGQGATYF